MSRRATSGLAFAARGGAAERVAACMLGISWRHWRILLAGALLGAAVCTAWLVSQPPRYLAETLLLPSALQTSVQFEPSIQTVGDPQSSGGTGTPMSPERRQAIADLANSSMVEAGAIDILQRQSPASQLDDSTLRSAVAVSLKPRSEVISIQAQAASSAEAMEIANAWSQSYLDVVDRIYGSDAPAADLLKLRQERDAALDHVQDAEAALAGFLGTTDLAANQREAADKTHLLQLLESAYQGGAFASASNARDVDVQLARLDYRLADVQTIDDMAATLRRLDVTRQNLAAIARADAASGPTQSDVLAVTLAQVELATVANSLPDGVTIQLPGTPGDQTISAAQLVAQIDRARQGVADDLQARRAAFEQARTAQIDQLEADLRDLHSHTEAATAQKRELTQARDLAWSTYTAVARKVNELEVARATDAHALVLASAASGAARVAGVPAVVLLLVSALAGALVALGLAALLELRPDVPSAMASPPPPAPVVAAG